MQIGQDVYTDVEFYDIVLLPRSVDPVFQFAHRVVGVVSLEMIISGGIVGVHQRDGGV